MSLSYSECKKLKDAGYPQPDFEKGRFVCIHGEPIQPCETTCYSPTLEELIEACGERIDRLEQQFVSLEGEDEISWVACYDKRFYHGKGKTPIEAVANLYIALQGKNETSS